MPEQNIEKAIFAAVKADDAVAVERLLFENSPAQRVTGPSGRTWLHMAAGYGSTHVMQALLRLGLAVDTRTDDSSETPLHTAALDDRQEAIRLLLSVGADVGATDKFGRTPLMMAALADAAGAATTLLDGGANPAAVAGNPPRTARDMAGERGSLSVLAVLPPDPAGPAGGATDINPSEGEVARHVAVALGPLRRAGLQEIVPGDVPFALRVIEPTDCRDRLTLFTDGVSAEPLPNVPGAATFAELMLNLPAGWPLDDLEDEAAYWPIRWLRQLAHGAHDGGVIVADGATVDAGAPLGPNTAMSCFLLFEARDVDRIRVADGREVAFFHAMPVHAAEAAFAREEGAWALLERFQENKVDIALDPGRESVVA